jgi:hypothetical protein
VVREQKILLWVERQLKIYMNKKTVTLLVAYLQGGKKIFKGVCVIVFDELTISVSAFQKSDVLGFDV